MHAPYGRAPQKNRDDLRAPTRASLKFGSKQARNAFDGRGSGRVVQSGVRVRQTKNQGCRARTQRGPRSGFR
jgi:hypothetical protein